ncbi:MAG TPA: hypothetical protein VKB38_03780 [Terracidiphilus sp.]|nr:hypothetical protein [Terracidiphilus sp.]
MNPLFNRKKKQDTEDLISRYLDAVSTTADQRMLVMQEILARPGSQSAPVHEQEFFELCIEESDDVFRPGFLVKQTHAEWSEIDGQVMFEEPKWERWPTLKKAEALYEAWRKALVDLGFSQSDMDV